MIRVWRSPFSWQPKPLVALVATIAAAWWWYVGAKSLHVGADDTRMLAAFFSDEVLHVGLVRSALQRESWDFHFGAYGHLVLNQALLTLRLLYTGTTPTDTQIVVVLRSVSLFWAWGATVLTYVLVSRALSPVWGAIGTVLFFTHPMVVQWATLAHPDTAQLFLLDLALLFLASFEREPQASRFVAASISAGLAFATKYLSLAMVPLFLVLLVRHGTHEVLKRQSAFPWRLVFICRGGLAVLSAVALCIGWVVNPLDVARAVAEDGRVDFPHAEVMSVVLDWFFMYGGLFCLVFVFWRRPWRQLLTDTHAATVVRWMLIGAAAFAASFLLVSPLSLARLVMIKGILEVGSALLFSTGADWPSFAYGALGPLATLLLVVGFARGLASFLHPRAHRDAPEIGLAAAWVGSFALVLLVVRYPAPHYLLPIFSCAVLLVLAGAQLIGATAAKWLPGPVVRAVALGAGVVTVAVCLQTGRAQLESWHSRVEDSPAVAAGRWLTDNVDPDKRILYDHGAYVPPQFQNATPTWQGSTKLLEDVSPDIVVLSKWRPYPDAPTETVKYYECMNAESCGYRRIFDGQTLAILTRDTVN